MKPIKTNSARTGNKALLKKRDAHSEVVVAPGDLAQSPDAELLATPGPLQPVDSSPTPDIQQSWDQRRATEEEERLAPQPQEGIQIAALGDLNDLLQPLDAALLDGSAQQPDQLLALARDGSALTPEITWQTTTDTPIAAEEFTSYEVAQASTTPPADGGGSNSEDKSKYGLLALLLLGAGAAGGGGSSGTSLTQIGNGYVIDGPVKNAVVFRDTDGDGKWLDVNGDGKWEAGDEFITSTDATGQFVALGGTGNVIGTSMDRLVSTKTSGGATFHSYNSSETITDSNGKAITGQAIDTDNGQIFNGYFLAPGIAIQSTVSGNTQTNTIYVTGLSTLTAALLEAQGITNPTQAQIIAAANQINGLLVTDYDKDAVSTAGDTVDFFLSNGNDQVTKLLAALAAKAEAAGEDPLQAMQDALQTLADVIKNGVSVNETGYGDSNTIDLTDPTDVGDIFDLTPGEARGVTNVVAGGDGGAAQLSIWHDSANGEDGMSNIATVNTDGTLGSITVLASTVSSDANLTVDPDANDTTALWHSAITVSAAGASSDAHLLISSGSGSIDDTDINATANYATSSATILGDIEFGDHITITASGASSEADLYLGEDGGVFFTDVPGGITVTASGYSANANLYANESSGTISSISVAADDYSSSANVEIGTSSDALTINESLNVEANGDYGDASLYIGSSCDTAAPVTLEDVAVTVSTTGSYSSASLDVFNATGTISSIEITASGYCSDACADIGGSDLDITGNITVQTVDQGEDASGEYAHANAYIAVDGTISGNVTVEANGYGSLACADIGAYTQAQNERQVFQTSGVSHDLVSGDVIELTIDGTTISWDPLESTCRHASLSIL